MLINYRHIRSFSLSLRSYGKNQLGTWQPEGLLPKRMQIKDTALLDEQSVKTRKEGRIELLRQRTLLANATNKYAYKHGNQDLRKSIRWIIYTSLLFTFGVLINMFNNFLLYQEFKPYTEEYLKELRTLLHDNNYNYEKCISDFYTYSLESVLTHRMQHLLIIAHNNDKEFYNLMVAAVDFVGYLTSKLNDNCDKKFFGKRGFYVHSYATGFRDIFVKYPHITLLTLGEMKKLHKNNVAAGHQIMPRKFLLYLLLNRATVPQNVKLELAVILHEFHGLIDYFMNTELTESDAYEIVAAADDDADRKIFTDISRELLKEVIELKMK